MISGVQVSPGLLAVRARLNLLDVSGKGWTGVG